MPKTNWQQEIWDAAQRKKLGESESAERAPQQMRSKENKYIAEFLNHLKWSKLPMPTHGQGCENKEYIFHPERKWRFDLCWIGIGKKLAVEYQGLNWKADSDEQSGHQSISGLMRDYEKFTEASLAGWTLILITAETVNNGQAIRWIERGLAK